MYLWFNHIKNRGVLHSKPRKKNHDRFMLNSLEFALHIKYNKFYSFAADIQYFFNLLYASL